MTNINWDEKPDWADSYCEIDQDNIFWMNDEQYEYIRSDCSIYKFKYDVAYKLQDTIGKRIYPSYPTAKQWRGPEDGLPPIGMKAVTSGGECVILGVDDNKREVALQWVSDGELGVVSLQCVKPIKSDRENWLESVYKLFPNIEDCPKEAHLMKIYDAGARFVEVKK